VDFITWSKPTGGRFHTYIDYISEGEYSDDTQLSLCTARSLEADGRFNPDHFAQELIAWNNYARGAGSAISAAARNLRQSKAARWNNNFFGSSDRGGRRGYVNAGGNGAAMRVGPLALANRLDARRTAEGVWHNAITTHGHPRAIVGALTFAEALRVLSEGSALTDRSLISHLWDHVEGIVVPSTPPFREWRARWEKAAGKSLDVALGDTRQEMRLLLELAGDGVQRPLADVLTEMGAFRNQTKGSGTGTVAAAIHAYLRTPDNYRAGVIELVNCLGIDTDTIAAMYGSLVGVRLKSLAIPDIWASRVQDYEYLLTVADVLASISLRQAKSNPLRVDVTMLRQRERNGLVELSRSRIITKGQRVMHDLLGPGWVQAVSEQSVRSGGTMLLADVVLDTGQTLRFKSFRSEAPSAKRGGRLGTRSSPQRRLL
jgi:ADP-ribosylglycohydrolase